jgi:hypothetical protein
LHSRAVAATFRVALQFVLSFVWAMVLSLSMTISSGRAGFHAMTGQEYLACYDGVNAAGRLIFQQSVT